MEKPLVGIIMGSKSDLETMQHTADVCEELGVPHEVRIVSAHRTPELMAGYARTAAERGIEVIVAGAGGAAHLPGMVAAYTVLPVIGVPIESHALRGMDSLLSIVQMPRGVPVATVAIGNAGAVNAGLLAAQIIGLKRPEYQRKLASRRESSAREVRQMSEVRVVSPAAKPLSEKTVVSPAAKLPPAARARARRPGDPARPARSR